MLEPSMLEPSITVRPVGEADLELVVNLSRLAFAPLRSNEEVAREWYGSTPNLPDRKLFLAVDEAGRGMGGYAELDLGVFLAGRELPAIGIAGVAVALESRGQGVARLMLETALKQAQAQEIPIAMLYPFQHGFYRKLGWAWVGQPHQYRVSPRSLPKFQEPGLVPYSADQHQALLQDLYRQVAPQRNGWLQRRSWQWEERLKPSNGKEIYVCVEAGTVQGYVIFQFTAEPRNSLSVVVQEWVASSSSAYRGILGFLAALRDQVATVVWNTDSSDPFPHLLKEQRRDPNLDSDAFRFGLTHRFGELGGGFMWRLVDLKRALELRSIPPGDPFVLTFQVFDPVLGRQTVTAEFAEGQIRCSNQSSAPQVKISIEHLTALFAGVRRSTDLLWTGEIQVEGNSSEVQAVLTHLDMAWQTPSPFCWDFF